MGTEKFPGNSRAALTKCLQIFGISHQEAGKSTQVPVDPKCNLTAMPLLSRRTISPKGNSGMAPSLQAKFDCKQKKLSKGSYLGTYGK